MRDLHRERAARENNVRPEDVTLKQRAAAKARNFFDAYGYTEQRNALVQSANAELIEVDYASVELRILAHMQEKKR